MKIIKSTLLGMSIVAAAQVSFAATTGATLDTVDPEADRKAFVEYWTNRNPGVAPEAYVDGVYALDEDSRAQWLEIEEFPPYELDLEEGEEAFNETFANGKTYADCFENGGIGIRQNYPMWDADRQTVVTLEMAINECRTNNGEEPLKWKTGKLAQISAYMAYTSRGNVFDIQLPDDGAKAAYLDGKKFFYTKRGQLNLSCADCHMTGSGIYLRSEFLGPALGHTTHFPLVRSKWGNLGTLHRRYEGCHRDSRSEPLKAQSETFRNLELFETYMQNGLVVNGPGSRK